MPQTVGVDVIYRLHHLIHSNMSTHFGGSLNVSRGVDGVPHWCYVDAYNPTRVVPFDSNAAKSAALTYKPICMMWVREH